ncbi:GIY-YIG nuclease family protein [Brachybacterium sp. AOP42-B2-9]|uniref:GIY-YIG nuclease family protein n=1 Tax=Brachybacterium sp. AOP42-B2-9 TaxID=3457672 RepID=UPI0040336018
MSDLEKTPDDAFQKLLDSDVDGLLEASEKPKKVTSSDRLERAFLEIVEFRRAEGRLPSSSTREIAERKLGARLDGILANDEKIEALKHLDEFDLLIEPEPPASLDELLENDDLDLLSDDSGLHDVSDLPARRSPADHASAKRVKAENFEEYEPLFKQKHAELADGTFSLVPYSGIHLIAEGAFLVLNGVMLFVAEVRDAEYKETTVRVNRRERTRVIFENGTESSMYRQSLSIRLFEQDGRALARTGHDLAEIGDADRESGHIYVLRSRSDHPQISGCENLYKIGFSTTTVQKRIARAATDPTYLMAPVEVVEDYRVYNLKPSALEHLLHRLFAEVRLNVSQIDATGRRYDPSEWFVVPREVINQAIKMIISGEIVNYEYDAKQLKIVERRAQ